MSGTCTILNEEPVNTGIKVVIFFGNKTASNTNIIPTIETNVNMVLLETFPPTKLPRKRPISIRNQ